MDREAFKRLTEEKIIILDGATGTQLQKRGMPAGVCPEQWVIEHPDTIIEIQKEYIDAGSDIVYTCTFGGNKIKLDSFGLGEKTVEINRKLAQLSKQAAGSKALVAGDIAPTGRFLAPLGDMDFEECVNAYKIQVEGLLEGGVDLFVIETMMDIQEARAALLAVKESCSLPVIVTMTYDSNGRTLTGTDPVTALITLQSMGADAVGCNCSAGPEGMLEFIRTMKPYAKVPLIAKPNAGLPKLVDGVSVFDMDAGNFGSYAADFVEAGVNLFGGCCGTSPEYIYEISSRTSGLAPKPPEDRSYCAVTSSRKTVFFGSDMPLTVVGERINPTGKKKLQEELRQGLTFMVQDLAEEQEDKGAQILDVNVGMPGIDEKDIMVKVVEELSTVMDTPLCLDSSSPEVLEAGLRVYPGRAIVNSLSLEKHKVRQLLPVIAKYGAVPVLLPLDDDGIPDNMEKRRDIVLKIFEETKKYNYGKDDIIVDGLVMTVSSDQKAALETLKLVEWCSREFGCSTIIGLSNVSFGLPERKWMNAAFLAMAVDRGLTMAIANPSSDVVMNIKTACDVLCAKDIGGINYISRFAEEGWNKASEGKGNKAGNENLSSSIYDAVLKGDTENIVNHIDTALKEGMQPANIVDGLLIPAINEVGKLFEEKRFFLPQLIRSAEAMKLGFEHLKPLLKSEDTKLQKEEVPVVLATVKGDIHDIGKNIVGLMLENYGFKVYDLGKDVSAERIVSEAKRIGAGIVGLSALMTTTMVEMKEVIALAKKEGLNCRFMVGGAVVNEDYAREIGADGYSKDAYGAVNLAKELAKTV